MSRKKIKILIVAFSDSVHTARWISQLDHSKYEVHLFPSVPFRQIHPLVQNVTVWQLPHDKDDEDKGLFFKNPSIIYKSIEKLTGKSLVRKFAGRIKPWLRLSLQKTIELLRPEIIHSMESQNSGYLVNSLKFDNSKPFWIHSNWGIDIHYFGLFPYHQGQLKKLMSGVGILIVEGERDLQLARELGFRKNITIIPSVGGSPDFQLYDRLDSGIPASARKKIILKGYEGQERLASVALKALRSIRILLADYEVIVYSCNRKLLPLIEEIQSKKEFTLKVSVELTYQEILEMTAQSRLSITNNLSDGVPNTMLEAMAFGTFPVQSNTAITEEWIEDGVNGLLTVPTDESSIAAAISRALSDDNLVDKASMINRKLVREKLNMDIIRKQIDRVYGTTILNVPDLLPLPNGI